MSLLQSPKIVTDGLVFYYDMNNKKSFVGAPTTNYATDQNPRIDSSYASYVQTTAGTWPTKHPDAIRVYNNSGGEITGYVNTGVGDYTNTYHAIWTYDAELQKPVVTMRDYDGNWKAKSFGLTVSTPAQMGLALGSSYTISWLSWSDDITKCANAGMYSRRLSDGAYNFWDGQSNSQSTAFNTKARTWQRVYATYTVFSGMDINAGWSCYMYGHYGNRGTVKIADVQIEAAGYASSFNTGLTARTTTQAILDVTGNNTITASSLTYASNNTFSFNGSSNYIDVTNNLGVMASYTISFWAKRDVENRMPVAARVGTPFYWYGDNSWRYTHGGVGGEYYYAKPTSIPLGTWGHYCVVYNGANVSIYRQGVFQGSQATTGTADWTNGLRIGFWNGGAGYYWQGSIGTMSMYNRSLTATEVQQNFNAHRGRYSL
jgi:hypothetical protein